MASETPEPAAAGSRSHPGIAIGIVTLFVLTYYPLLQTGFSDHDSMFLTIRYWTEDTFFGWLSELAQLHGRWHYYYSGLMCVLPFLSQSFVYYKAVSLGALVLNAFAFYYVVARTTRAGSLAQFALLVYLLTIQIGANHSLLAGYFVFLHAGMFFMAFSILLFHRYLQCRRAPFLAASCALFALAVPMHETFALYAAVHLLLLVAHELGHGERLRFRALVAFVPFVAVGVAFAAASLVYRAMHPSEYAGNTLDPAALSVPRYFETFYVYTRSALPGFYFFDDKFRTIYDHYAPGFGARSSDLAFILADLRASWVLRAMAFAGVSALVLRRAEAVQGKALAIVAAVAALLVLIPNSLISLSALYQGAALDRIWMATHLTYLANFGVALFLASTLWFPLRYLAQHRFRLVRATTIVFVGTVVAFFSVITDFSNHYAAKMLGMHRQKWVAMDEFMRTDEFGGIPDGEVIFSPDLWGGVYNPYYRFSNYQGGHLVKESYTGETYWAKYIRAKTGRRIWVFGQWMFLNGFLNENPKADRRFFHLRYAQDPAEPRQFIAVGEVTRKDREHSDEVTIHSLSIPEPWMIAFDSADGTHVVHTHLVGDVARGIHVVRDGVGQFTIEARGIDMPTLVVSGSQIDPNRDTR